MHATQRKPFKAVGVVELEPRTEFSLYCDWLALKFLYYANTGHIAEAQDVLNAWDNAHC